MSETRVTPHVHDCTGPDLTCHCGFKVVVPRYSVEFCIYDNDAGEITLSDCFSSDSLEAAIDALEDAARKLENL